MVFIFAIALLLCIGLIFAGLRRVPEDVVCTVHRNGRYLRTLTQGFHFTWPFLDKIAHRVHLVGHQVELTPQTLHNATAAYGAVYYQILEPERTGGVLDEVDALVEREARQRLAILATDTALAEGSALGARLKGELNQRLSRLGLRITRCQVSLPTPKSG